MRSTPKVPDNTPANVLIKPFLPQQVSAKLMVSSEGCVNRIMFSAQCFTQMNQFRT